jgi:DNA mismatch repair protein MutS
VQRAEEVLKRLESTKDSTIMRALFIQNGSRLTDNANNGLMVAAEGNGHYNAGIQFIGHNSEYEWQTEEARLAAQKLEYHVGGPSSLDAIDVCAITPLDALNLLFVMQKKRNS